MSTLLLNIAGVVMIVAIVWWFWLSRKAAGTAVRGNSIDIIVDGGVYDPGEIHTRVGRPTTLRFIRKDSSPCAEKVIFADLDVSADLPIGKPYELTITPQKAGDFDFTCQMAMYRGKLIVEE